MAACGLCVSAVLTAVPVKGAADRHTHRDWCMISHGWMRRPTTESLRRLYWTPFLFITIHDTGLALLCRRDHRHWSDGRARAVASWSGW